MRHEVNPAGLALDLFRHMFGQPFDRPGQGGIPDAARTPAERLEPARRAVHRDPGPTHPVK